MKPLLALTALILALGASAGCSPTTGTEPNVIKAADKDRAPSKRAKPAQ